MPDPSALYDDLIAGIPHDVTVTDYAQGPQWSRVRTSDGGFGMALYTPSATRPGTWKGTLQDASLHDVALLCHSWNFQEASYGVAAINAWYNHPDRAHQVGHPRPRSGLETAFVSYAPQLAGKRVVVVGHFPGMEDELAGAGELIILERAPQPGDYPDSAAEYVIPGADYLFITGSPLVNKTLPRLLELARAGNVHTVLVGPSVPLAPVFSDYGVSGLSGFIPTDMQALEYSLRGVGDQAKFNHGRMVDLEL